MNKLFSRMQAHAIRYWLSVFLGLLIAIPAFSAEKPGVLIDLQKAFKDRDSARAGAILGGTSEVSQEFGWPLIVVAANHRHLGLVQEIMDSGADLNDSNHNGDTALIIAAYNNYPEVVRLLAGRGANLNARGKDGATALIWAAKKGYLEVSEILLAAGANVNLDIDPHFRHQYSAPFGTPFPGHAGSTALLLAAEKGNVAMLNALLKAGADVNATNAACESALDVARFGQRDEVAAILLKHGAMDSPRCLYSEHLQHSGLTVLGVFICLVIWEVYRRKPAAGARVLGYLINLPVALLIYESGDSIEPFSIIVPMANIVLLLFHNSARLIQAAILMNAIAMAVGIIALYVDYNVSNPMLIFYIIAAALIAVIQLVNIRVLRAQTSEPKGPD